VPLPRDPAAPHPRDLVLVGGGHAHVFVLKSFGLRPVPGARLTLVTRDVETPYSGMLPGLLAGHYGHDDCHLDLLKLARFAQARLIHAEAVGIDRAARRVLLPGRPPVGYDLLSLDIGSTPGLAVPGSAAHALPLKPIDRLEGRWLDLERAVATAKRPWRVVVVGGGAAGVEVALAAAHRLSRIAGAGVAVALLTRGLIVGRHGARARRLLLRHLEAARIEVHEHAEIDAVEAGAVRCADGRRLPADTVLWATGAAAAPWLARTGLELDDRGFVAVDACLRSTGDPRVFAAGDVASMRDHPRDKAGVFAVRQGPPLARNLRRALRGLAPLPFVPQRRALSLIGTGDRHAVAVRGRFAVQGRWAWTLKEAIDRRWMRGYAQLPAGRAVEPDRHPGRGAGMPAAPLAGLLEQLRREFGTEAVADDPADAAAFPDEPAFRCVAPLPAPVDDPFVLGRIAAIHALGRIHAAGCRPRSVLVLAPAPGDTRQEDDLDQMLRGALPVLRDAGARLAGGRVAAPGRAALGFAVDAVPASGRPPHGNGLRPGDRLVLTKPLGTGILLAAVTAGRAKARWAAQAIASMCRSNGPASRILAGHGAVACAEVAESGLGAGLLEMLRARGVDARIDALPALEGAAGLAGTDTPPAALAGNVHAVAPCLDGADRTDLALLCDPQTAGGLLAGVPADRAEACVAALRAGGDAGAAIIGTVLPGTARSPLIRVAPRPFQRA
jgi:selenide,water dikinase